MDRQRLNTGSARSYLVTLMGEFMAAPEAEPIWTASIVEVMERVGFAERATRQSLNRARDVGWLSSEKFGRRTRWSIAEKGQLFVRAGSREVQGLQDAGTGWDGRWLVVHVTLPDAMRPERLKLYRALGWNGFGNPSPTMWISPHVDKTEAVRAALFEFGAQEHAIVFVGALSDVGISEFALVDRAWDHASIRSHYQNLLSQFATDGTTSDAAHLPRYIQLVNAFQRLPSIDPRLPARLTVGHPSNRGDLEELIAIRREMRPKAHQIWTDLVAI